MYIYIYIYMYMCILYIYICIDLFIYLVIKIIASGNGRFATRNFLFRATLAVSFAGHVYIDCCDSK